jgi:hypothetical protein
MIQTVNFHTFHDAFTSRRPDNFSYSGLRALFDYLEQLEEDTGESSELDVIAICCDFSQYDSVEDALEEYRLEDREELEDNTLLIECADGSVIIQNF